MHVQLLIAVKISHCTLVVWLCFGTFSAFPDTYMERWMQAKQRHDFPRKTEQASVTTDMTVIKSLIIGKEEAVVAAS